LHHLAFPEAFSVAVDLENDPAIDRGGFLQGSLFGSTHQLAQDDAGDDFVINANLCGKTLAGPLEVQPEDAAGMSAQAAGIFPAADGQGFSFRGKIGAGLVPGLDYFIEAQGPEQDFLAGRGGRGFPCRGRGRFFLGVADGGEGG
jgi:hypothetical protein